MADYSDPSYVKQMVCVNSLLVLFKKKLKSQGYQNKNFPLVSAYFICLQIL